MKYRNSSFLFLMMFFIGCGSIPKIIQKEYAYDKMLFGTHRFEFDIHLENIGDSGKIYDLINKLIYDNKSFDEYMEYTERKFTGNVDEADFPPMIAEDGTEYLYHSDLIEKYAIVFNNSTHIIFKYNLYFSNSRAAHGNYLIKYFIIDLMEERILDIDDLIYPISDDVLKRVIASKYKMNNYLRDNIWPPDAINFSDENIELIWNIYTITPYVAGIIRIGIQDERIEQYLTEKGKMLRKTTAGKIR